MDIFTCDEDRRDFINSLIGLRTEASFSILAYCLMGNHFHLAVRVEQTPLSAVMQRLLTTYVRNFNMRHGREGHLLQARYKSILCLDDSYLLALIRYIHRNPVRAGLVSSPGEWPWSSYRQYAGDNLRSIADTRLFFQAAGIAAIDRDGYERWSTQADMEFEPWPKTDIGLPLLRSDDRSCPTLDALARDLYPDVWTDLRAGMRRKTLTAKKAILAEAALRLGFTQTSIASWMKCSPQAVHRLLQQKNS
jgi:REP element-mobilizing transposase RayT